jgi:hypothetical protein
VTRLAATTSRRSGPGLTLATHGVASREATNSGSASVVPIEPRRDHRNVANSIVRGGAGWRVNAIVREMGGFRGREGPEQGSRHTLGFTEQVSVVADRALGSHLSAGHADVASASHRSSHAVGAGVVAFCVQAVSAEDACCERLKSRCRPRETERPASRHCAHLRHRRAARRPTRSGRGRPRRPERRAPLVRRRTLAGGSRRTRKQSSDSRPRGGHAPGRGRASRAT